jgi:hypothetical protein
VAIAAALIVVVVVIGGGVLASRSYSPEAAASAYFTALDRGDDGGAWNSSIVDNANSPRADAAFLDRAALKAAISVAKPSYPGLTVGSATANGIAATVPISYRDSNGIHQLKARLLRNDTEKRLGFLPIWKVVVKPALLSINLPAGLAGFSIDGLPVSPARTVSVLPMRHRLAPRAGKLIAADSVDLDLSGTAGNTQTVAFASKLTDAGKQAATDALKQALTTCAASTLAQPPGCPQEAQASYLTNVQWQPVGDQTAGLTLGFDDRQQLIASGRYLMQLAYRTSPSSPIQHQAVGGPYSAQLVISGDQINVIKLTRVSGAAPAIRPAGATDQAAKDLVKAALTKCAAATVIAPPDCPQNDSLAIGSISDIQWHLNGDPTATATISWNGERSVLEVAGDLDMTVDYKLSGYTYHERSSTRRYRADLLWDGTALSVITIIGVLT